MSSCSVARSRAAAGEDFLTVLPASSEDGTSSDGASDETLAAASVRPDPAGSVAEPASGDGVHRGLVRDDDGGGVEPDADDRADDEDLGDDDLDDESALAADRTGDDIDTVTGSFEPAKADGVSGPDASSWPSEPEPPGSSGPESSGPELA
jgi:hypothetical protein